MPTEIKLPELGENIEAGDVLSIRVEPGATVAKGQTLLEIEAEKSTVEVPSPLDGKVTEIRVKKGDRVDVGQTVCLIEGADGKKSDGAITAPVRPTPESGTEPDRPMAPRPEQTPEETPAEQPPMVRTRLVTGPKRLPAEGRRAAEGREAPIPGPPPAPAEREAVEKLVPAGPATRLLARELGVDLHRVAGTAPGGRVTREDVKEFVRQLAAGTARGVSSGIPVPPLPDFERWGAVERKPLDGIRRRTAEQMALAWSTVPHVTQQDVADITDLDAFRRQQEGKGPKLTITAFTLKASAVALKQFPQFNSSLDMTSGQLILKRYYHVGVAVDTDRGLLVPVLRDVERKSVSELAQELTEIADRARQKKLTADEMRGGTFTITNLGGIGGTAFSPIVNWPEVAILGMARSRLQPVVRDGAIVPRLLLPLCLSYDHRVIDGADAARFARRIAELLENPLQMLLHA
ncbi:MAG: 2-oxo acid dehydrogenase subunit E2 [Gemmataceae bacterium]|nr:2-oxo acid dehydrogenase subunit E2 [Gemmataceae bacterium]